MTLELWTIEIAPDQLAACVQAAAAGSPDGGLSFIEIEWWNRPAAMLHFMDGLVELKQTPADSPRGSAFGPQLEIRWRKVSDELRLSIISEIMLTGLEKADQTFAWKSIASVSTGWDGTSRRERSLLLWGAEYNSDSTWSELRIGRPLIYPITPQEVGEVSAVELKIVEYMNAAGQVILARRAGLQARRAKTKPQPEQEVQHA